MLSRRTWESIAGICGVNILAFMVIATMLGGDAVNGYAADGHYFLGNHGRFIEVSKAVFEYSRFHVYSGFISFPVAAFATWRAKRIASLERSS
jgi:hypothetical protein